MMLSPKQIAEALQVSESSVKRWCDSGRLKTQYTSGGHRRVGTKSLLQFLRDSNKTLVHPELLGLPAFPADENADPEKLSEQLCEALLNLDETRSRQIISELYLSGLSVLQIMETIIVPALHLIGDRWQCGDVQIFQERRGCEIVTILIHDLRRMIDEPPAEAPQAIGGAVSGDPYKIPSLVIETVLKEIGWNATSLGENLPLETFASAIDALNPTMLWLSLSYLRDVNQFLQEYQTFYQKYGDRVAIIIGGRAATPELLKQMKFFSYCESAERLVELCQTWSTIQQPHQTS
ncbi:B12 binding domain protein [Rubinisphaera italica]|uniref:B12 binding domain protein n=2 Tax=Rubinisphaera italica TaxID=2527969 RepID=A0A5C5XBA5_9PLAN|nr:B12 binding domain protein [Rubinisphaera italica]